MKLQKLNLDTLEKYRLKNLNGILGGGSLYTNCSVSGGMITCEDCIDDNYPPPMQ